MEKHTLVAFVLVTCLLGAPRLANAEQIVIGFTATVFHIDDRCFCLPEAIEIGDTVLGYYSYESPAIDTDPDPRIGRYLYLSAPNTFVAYLEGYVFRTDATNVDIEFIVEDSLDTGGGYGPRDLYRYASYNNETTMLGHFIERMYLLFDDLTVQALDDDSLPTSPPDLSLFGNSHGFAMHGEVYGEQWNLAANVIATQWGPPTSVSRTVPRPRVFLQNVPNPFGTSTRVIWRTAAREGATLRVYDVTGKLVRTLIEGARTAESTNSVVWDGTDTKGRSVPSGIYFLRLATPSVVETRKMVLVR